MWHIEYIAVLPYLSLSLSGEVAVGVKFNVCFFTDDGVVSNLCIS